MVKYRPKWCANCKYYLPQKGASSHKCLNKREVFIGESKIKCYAYTQVKGGEEYELEVSRTQAEVGDSEMKCKYCGQELTTEEQKNGCSICNRCVEKKFREYKNKRLQTLKKDMGS